MVMTMLLTLLSGRPVIYMQFLQHYLAKCLFLQLPVAMPAVVLPADHHLTSRQRLHCDGVANLLHSTTAVAHLNDDDLAGEVTNGACPTFYISAARIRTNRLYRCACPQCCG